MVHSVIKVHSHHRVRVYSCFFLFFSFFLFFFFFLQNSPNKGKDVDVQPTSNLFQLCDYEPKCGRCVLNFLKIVWYLTISTPYVNLHLKGHCVVQF